MTCHFWLGFWAGAAFVAVLVLGLIILEGDR
jgi:hypothetical protein